jgi:PAN domain
MQHVPSAARVSCASLWALTCLAIVLASSALLQAQEAGVNRPGGDYRSIELPSADPALCRRACDDEARCRAYTYVKPGVQGPSALCWLKSEVPPAVPDDCCASGVKADAGQAAAGEPSIGQSLKAGASKSVAADATPQAQEEGVDRPGENYKSLELPSADPALCRKACDDDVQCRAYSYVKPGVQGPSARCWLKSAVPPAVQDDCCVSGVKAASAPVPTTKAAIGLTERIRGYQVVGRDGRRIRFKIDYAINSTHGPSIGVGTWLYAGGEAFGGYQPVMFEPQGRGSIEQWLTLPPETRTYDEVEIFFFEPGQQPFLKQRFPLKQTWAPTP